MFAIAMLIAFAVSLALMVGTIEAGAKGWWVWVILSSFFLTLFVSQIRS